MKSSKRILIADDNDAIRKFFVKLLDRYGYSSLVAKNGFEAIDLIVSSKPDLIILDVVMPGCGGLEVMTEMKKKGINIPVIVITGYNTMDTAIKSLKYGAREYLTKPVSTDKVLALLEKYFSEADLKTKLDEDEGDLLETPIMELVGTNPKMLSIFNNVDELAAIKKEVNVIIQGERGTGKKTIAKLIHLKSGLPENKFASIDFSRLSDEAAEKRLFGCETGNSEKREISPGVFEIAANGTVFLENIDQSSPKIQEKFYGYLDRGEFKRWGGIEFIPIQSRIISSAAETIKENLKQETFSLNLYESLCDFEIVLPPLRERLDDLPKLVNHFLKITASMRKITVPLVPQQTLKYLSDYRWNRNVGELKEVIDNAIDSVQDNLLLPENIRLAHEEVLVFDRAILNKSLKEARKEVTEAFEKQFIVCQLIKSNGNVTQAANNSEVSRQIFHKMMKKHGVKT